MDTKKTIIVSILTTLATMFVVAVLVHLCCGRCGESASCSRQEYRIEKSCSGESKCEKQMDCSRKPSCGMGKEACKEGKMCASGKTCPMNAVDEMINKEVKVEVIEKK